METLLLENLAESQAFDAVLQTTPSIDGIVARYLQAVMFQKAAEKRAAAIAKAEKDLIDHYARTIQPKAQELGVRHARRVLSGLQGVPRDLGDPGFRRRILVDLKARPATRLRIVQAMVNDKANTLENRLAAYWLEPGLNDREKLDKLKATHFDMEKKRKDYEAGLRAYLKGEAETRPRKPNLDFASKLTSDTKQAFREQARRAGTDAETGHFVQQGYTTLVWIAVQATDACPDCRVRQGVQGDLRFWAKLGRPGEGKTICGAACFCMLVPASTLDRYPNLSQGLVYRVKPVLTSDAELRLLQGARPAR